MKKKLTLILFVTFISLTANASRLKKGFQALDIYNYFDAKHYFEKSQKRHLVPASYGLSIIYQRKDNPFHNIDSAYNQIMLAVNNFHSLKVKSKVKYKKIGIDSLKIYRQRGVITQKLYERALDVNSIYGYQDFMDKNPWSEHLNEVEILRDSLFFFEQHFTGTSNAYQKFLTTYPNSIYSNRAQNLYDKSFYIEQTQNNQLISYVHFINMAPQSPFVADAEDRIFELSTKNKTTQSYENFILDYPKNRNINKAWKQLYNTYLQNGYSKFDIESFLKKYPNYPFKSNAEKELLMEGVEFLSVRQFNKWGFISDNLSYFIDFDYDFVEPFSEGLALVTLDDKVGFITKTGTLKIPFKFDDAYSFHNGYAVVEVNEKFGLINRSGEYIIEPKYEDLGNISDGLSYFETKEGYGYFDSKGIVRLKPTYTDAGDFNNGIALVSRNNNYGIIDLFGTTSIPFMFTAILQLDSTNFAVKLNNNWGVLNLDKDTILPIDNSYINQIGNGILLVEKQNQFNYWNLLDSSFISKIWFDIYPEYKVLATFRKGYAKIKTEGGYNFIDKNGQILFSKPYQNLGEYANYIAFSQKDKWGYITSKNQQIIKPSYEKTHSFNMVGGIVELMPLKGIISSKGKLLLDVFYEEFTFISDSILIVKSRGKYGLISVSKDTIIAIQYKLIEPYSNSVVKVVSDDSQWYFNFIETRWIKKED